MNTLQIFNDDLKELSLQEMKDISGGESGWYWVAYYLGITFKETASGLDHYSRHKAEFGK